MPEGIPVVSKRPDLRRAESGRATVVEGVSGTANETLHVDLTTSRVDREEVFAAFCIGWFSREHERFVEVGTYGVRFQPRHGAAVGWAQRETEQGPECVRAAIGTLVAWANHPEALGGRNQSLSGGYCDGLYRERNILIRNNLFADCTQRKAVLQNACCRVDHHSEVVEREW